MELTILLSKVFGIYLVVMGFIMMVRRDYFKSMVGNIAEAPATRLMIGVIMFIAASFLVVSHQRWGSLAEGLISFLGWLMLLKALLYINLSAEGVKTWIAKFNVDGRYRWGGLLAILVGLYFLNFGFGFF